MWKSRRASWAGLRVPGEPDGFCGRKATLKLVSKYTWRLTSTETIRLIRDGENGGKGDREVGGEGDYRPIATLSPPE